MVRMIVTELGRERLDGGVLIKAGGEFDAPENEVEVLKALGLAVEVPPPPLPPAPRPRGRPPGSPNRPKPVVDPEVFPEPVTQEVSEPHVVQPEAAVAADAKVIRAPEPTADELARERDPSLPIFKDQEEPDDGRYQRRDLRAEE